MKSADETKKKSGGPLFSVIIPVFNRRALLGRALDSVLSQTCQNFEIIVVDDGSSDKPEEIVARLNDPRIVMLRRDHQGGNAARNSGIDHANGQYVALLDSDDQYLPHHLETMAQLLSQTCDTVAYAPVRVFRGAAAEYTKPSRAVLRGEEMASYLLRRRGYVATSTIVLRTETARRIRYDEDLPFGQDADFAIRLWLAGQSFVMAREPGARWEDTARPDRVSAGRKGVLLVKWLERMSPLISMKARIGYRGWAIAKGLAATAPAQAARYYFAALLRGCYSPSLACVIFAQIFISDEIYRKAANRYIRARAAFRPARIARTRQQA